MEKSNGVNKLVMDILKNKDENNVINNMNSTLNNMNSSNIQGNGGF